MSDDHDLGFSFRKIRDGYEILHHGSRAATLRGVKASRFELAIAETGFTDLQRHMASLTGNYKRGNERSAAKHPRNRR